MQTRLHEAHEDRLNAEKNDCIEKARECVRQKDKATGMVFMRKAQILKNQQQRISTMRQACENASRAIEDSKMLRETVNVLSNVSAHMPPDTNKLFGEAAELSDKLAEVKDSMNSVNDELGANREDDDDFEDEWQAMVADVEKEKEQEADVERMKIENAPMAPNHQPLKVHTLPASKSVQSRNPYSMLEE